MGDPPKLRIIGKTYKSSKAIKEQIALRSLSPDCTSAGSEEEAIRCLFITKAFPSVLNSWRLCLNYNSVSSITLDCDNLPQILFGQGIALDRVAELYNYCGGITYQVGRHAKSILIYEDNADRLLCLARNITVFCQEGIVRAADILLVEAAPDVVGSEAVFERITSFSPTVAFFSLSWGQYWKTKRIDCVMNGKKYSPLELARRLLPFTPVVFQLPLPEFYNPGFSCKPTIVSREGTVSYALYVLKRPADAIRR